MAKSVSTFIDTLAVLLPLCADFRHSRNVEMAIKTQFHSLLWRAANPRWDCRHLYVSWQRAHKNRERKSSTVWRAVECVMRLMLEPAVSSEKKPSEMTENEKRIFFNSARKCNVKDARRSEEWMKFQYECESLFPFGLCHMMIKTREKRKALALNYFSKSASSDCQVHSGY